jgi:putative membrane protein
VGLTPADRRCILWFVLGLAILWAASDWPIATLGGAYLLSVHVVIYVLYTFFAAPLLMLGTPPWLFERIVARLRLGAVIGTLAIPWVAGLQVNLILVLTHLPPVVDNLRSQQAGSFLLDVLWVISALVAWLPVASPRRSQRITSPIYMCAYLFLAFQVFPMLPGSLITFASLPIYRVYELAPRIGTWSAVNDQQLAGALMAIGCTPVVWTLIAVIFIRTTDDRDTRPPPLAATAAELRALRDDIDRTETDGAVTGPAGSSPISSGSAPLAADGGG